MSIDIETEVRKEVRAWSAHALEKANGNYNSFPACPFAKKAWLNNKVDIQFKYDGDPTPLYTTLAQYDNDYELIIVVDFDYDSDADRFHNYLEGLNECISANFFGDQDLYVMGFHPADGGNDLLDDEEFEVEVEYTYAMVFVQRLSLLCKASDTLRKVGYYNRDQGGYEAEDIIKRREELYRRFTPYGIKKIPA